LLFLFHLDLDYTSCYPVRIEASTAKLLLVTGS
jgi:hypothetical protein